MQTVTKVLVRTLLFQVMADLDQGRPRKRPSELHRPSDDGFRRSLNASIQYWGCGMEYEKRLARRLILIEYRKRRPARRWATIAGMSRPSSTLRLVDDLENDTRLLVRCCRAAAQSILKGGEQA